jgi:NH3-dependent NAD+ synthetase
MNSMTDSPALGRRTVLAGVSGGIDGTSVGLVDAPE